MYGHSSNKMTTIYSAAPPHELDNWEHVMPYVKSSRDQDAK